MRYRFSRIRLIIYRIGKDVKSQAHLYSDRRNVNSYPMEGNLALFIKMYNAYAF